MTIERDYQPHLWPKGETVGKRNCTQRWQLLQPFLDRRGTDLLIVDVGSAQGWFPIAIAQHMPDAHIVSVEEDVEAASLQRQLLAANGITNVRLINERWNESNMHAWGIGVDVTLLFSVLHWMNDPAEAFRNVLSMSEWVVIEHPDPRDDGACGQSKLGEIGEIVRWVAQFPVAEVGLLGRVSRHTSNHDAWMIYVKSSSSGIGSA